MPLGKFHTNTGLLLKQIMKTYLSVLFLVEWIWKLFSSQDDNFYACRICTFKCLKLANHSKTVGLILKHLNKEHQVTSGDQIITGPECMSDGVDDDDERAAAVDYLTSEVLQC